MKKLIICLFLMALSGGQMVAQSGATVAVYSRHTLRGLSSKMPPGTVEVPAIGLTCALPALSYEMNATTAGLTFARQEYPMALQAAVSFAMASIGEKDDFDGRWDTIRADLATQRTFETALHIRLGLGGNIPLTGCPTEGGKVSDPVTSTAWVAEVVGKDVLQSLPLPSGSVERLQASGEAFATALHKALTGKDETVRLPLLMDGKIKTPLFEALSLLAASLEMSAPKGPPIPLVLGQDTKGGDVANVVALGLSLIASRWVTLFPGETGDLAAYFPLTYIDGLPAGRHEILVGHDEQLFCIKQSLGLVSFEKEPASARVYPMETLVFVRNAGQVAIVGMRMQYERDGQTKGKFQHSLLWKGPVKDWESRLAAVKTRLQTSPLTARWIDTPIPPVAEIRVLD